MNHMQSYQMQVLLRPGDVAIDVGANLGCYTVALAEAHEAFQLYDLMAQEPESVRVVRLDDLLLDGERAQSWALPLVKDVRLIKIDVEGMEVAVVQGALGLISHFRPIIWAENNAYFDSGGKDTAFLQALASVGYQCARADSAPGDVICTDAGGQGHQIP
ncbi:Hypothetical protein SCF082_LOCUS49397 [Durusdinium trenchii]|uniref:Methyltransferase FkbM domain-containing protein n=1 Tax=Durusdinium trenchii TaxID=1381693 RepID=A0ABP0S121_9DINO